MDSMFNATFMTAKRLKKREHLPQSTAVQSDETRAGKAQESKGNVRLRHKDHTLDPSVPSKVCLKIKTKRSQVFIWSLL